jgi:cellulose synthase operon protein YhjQ
LSLGIPESNPTPKPASEVGETNTPEDVATLYSWANLHGAKYRDFSASRAQAREEARLRVEAAQAEERRRQQEEADRIAQEQAQVAARLAAEAAEEARQAEAERLAEISRQAEIERQAVLAAQEAQRQAALQRSWQPPAEGDVRRPTVDFGASSPPPASFPAQPNPYPEQADDIQASLTQNAPFEPAFHVQTVAAETPRENVNPRYGLYRSEPVDDRQPPAPSYLPLATSPSFPTQPRPISSDPFSMQSPHYSGEPSRLAGSETTRPPFEETFEASKSGRDSSYGSGNPEKSIQSPWNVPNYREDSPEIRESRDFIAGPAWLAAEPPRPAQQPIAVQTPQPPQRSDLPRLTQAPTPMYNQPVGFSAPMPPVSQPMYAQSSTGSPLPGPVGERIASEPPAAKIDGTLAGSRDRIASRWFALKGVFDPQTTAIEPAPVQPPAQVPALAVFSLAGGVGKTSLVASLGRALSSRGERVLLVDTAAFGLLPFYFGARDQRPGILRTFNPPGVSGDAPVQVVTIDPEAHPSEHSRPEPAQGGNQAGQPDWLTEEVGRYTRNANRLILDLPTASGATTRRILRLSPVVLVPVLADMNSVVSVSAIESFFRNSAGGQDSTGKPISPFYVLNQFDYSLPLHLDVREILRDRIGDRLLPFALRRSPAVSEALAEGMTVMDYAPSAVIAEDYANLAGWVRSLSAPATQTYRGVRWSER